MTGRRDIVTRLINWGNCQRGRSGGAMPARETRRSSPYGGQGYKCMTGVVCNIMKEAALGPVGSKTAQSRLDFDDAAKIQRGFQRLHVRYQMLLKNLYVYGQSPNAICRQLSIRHSPGGHWNSALREAQDAIEDAADNEGNR